MYGTAKFPVIAPPPRGLATYLGCVYEQELRGECGYRGYRPCWNWGKYALINSQFAIVRWFGQLPLGGVGAFVPYNCTPGLPTGLNCVLPDPGGGFVETGPFAR